MAESSSQNSMEKQGFPLSFMDEPSSRNTMEKQGFPFSFMTEPSSQNSLEKQGFPLSFMAEPSSQNSLEKQGNFPFSFMAGPSSQNSMEKQGFPFPFMAEPSSQNSMEKQGFPLSFMAGPSSQNSTEKQGFPLSFMAGPSSQNYQPFNIDDRFQVPSFYPDSSFHQNSTCSYYNEFLNPVTQTRSVPQSYEGLEDAFKLLSLSMPHDNDNRDSDSNRLHRMRVESAARGQQIGFYNEGFLSGHLNSTVSTNFPSTPMADVFRRTRSFDELAHACSCPRSSRWGNHSTWDGNGSINHPQEWLRYSSLNELKGRVSSFAKDQNGCRLLQKEFENGMISREVFHMILSEVKIDLHELLVHQVANYLIRKTFKASNHQQRTELLLVLVTREQRFLEVCTDTHGTRAVQNIMEQISSQEHRSILLSTLRRIAVSLMKDIHGHHILERCFHKFSDEDTKHIVDEIANHFVEIATDKGGCCGLQQCLRYVNAEVRDRILPEVIANAFLLSGDRYGNYVVQYVLAMGLPHVTSKIIMQLRGSYVTFSTNKFGSNVVEKCLQFSGHNDFCMVIEEIMFHDDFVKVIQDAYGNYVVQSALKLSKGDLHNTLVRFILSHYQVLHSHLYGKLVVDRIKFNKNRVQYK